MDMRQYPQAARRVLAVDIEHLKVGGHQTIVGPVTMRFTLPPAIRQPPRRDDLAAIGDTAPGEGDRVALRVLLHALHWQPDKARHSGLLLALMCLSQYGR